MKLHVLFLINIIFFCTNGELLGFFLPKDVDMDAKVHVGLNSKALSFLDGVSHYRILPGIFKDEIKYHFDGLAAVMRFEFKNGTVSTVLSPVETQAYKHFETCLFFGSGTTTFGIEPCLRNPAVNLLPIEDQMGNEQMWMTIDEAFWSRMDRHTMKTVKGAVPAMKTTILNAHPACDRNTGECFVQHPCGLLPRSDEACISKLKPGKLIMHTEEVGRVKLDSGKHFLQHAHSLCITPNWVLAKLDWFVKRDASCPAPDTGGLIGKVHQALGNEFIFYNRKTNETKIFKANVEVINNHFINCYEDEKNDVIFDFVPATEKYLDNWFEKQLEKKLDWNSIMPDALHCTSHIDTKQIVCENFFPSKEETVTFDYPTFNPYYKMNANYSYAYGIGANTLDSIWMDKIIKINMKTRKVEQFWHEENVYVTEAGFVERSKDAEDDGVLLSILYNQTSHKSFLGIFEATDLSLVELVDLKTVIPFHAHSMSCDNGGCHSNP